MPTQCSIKPLEFEGHGSRRVVADFDDGPITSDAGALLLRQVDQRLSLIDQVADCFTYHRNPDRIQHSLRTLIAQRIVAIALGYEDLNDHDQLRHDPLMALFSENHRPDSTPLAGKSTLNRLELAPSDDPDRYHKIDHDPVAPTPASWLPPCQPRTTPLSPSMSRLTVPAVRWKTASRSSNSTCLPIAPPPTPSGPTNSGSP